MPGKLRVHELAKELGITSKELLATLKDKGEYVKTASSTIEAPVVKKMRELYKDKAPTTAANTTAGSQPVSTTKTRARTTERAEKTSVKSAAAAQSSATAAAPHSAKGAHSGAAKPGPRAAQAKPGATPAALAGSRKGTATPAFMKPSSLTKTASDASSRSASSTHTKNSISAATSATAPHPGSARPGPRPGPRPGAHHNKNAQASHSDSAKSGARTADNQAIPRPRRAPRAANNPFATGSPSGTSPRPSTSRGAGRGSGGNRPGQGGASRGQGGRRPSPGMMPSSVPSPGSMPTHTSTHQGGGNRGGGRGSGSSGAGSSGGGFRGRGGRRGGTAGAFGRPGGAPRKGRKSKRQKRSEYEAMKAPNIIGGVHLPDGGGQTLRLPRGASLADFAEKIGADASSLVQALFNLGEMVTATASVSDETLMLLGSEINYDVQVVSPEDEDRELLESFDLQFGEDEGDQSDLERRPPVVTVMGHVDHGKTRLLDTIRHTNEGKFEAGGITQGIGAYQVDVVLDGRHRKVTFLDTPGHEAFTAMRARGANSTDIAILVVAADDGVMPQTVEAINHAKAAKVPIVVAVNKIDKEGANPAKVRAELAEYGLLPEEYGGDTMFVDISAKQGTNIDALLEAVLLTADAELELVANPNMPAQGVAIEAHLDRGRGPVATVIVQRGTLRVGDSIVAGDAYGRVRRMVDEYGTDVEEAGPSRPVQVQGLNSVPGAGDNLLVVDDDRVARQIANQRNARRRNALQAKARKRISLEDLDAVLKETNTLNLILKGDNAGSVEALEDALLKIDVDDEVQLDIIDRGVGAVTQTNVSLAAASNAVIIAFNVRSEGKATEFANAEGVDIRYYTVIYKVLEEVEAALKGMLKPIYEEHEIGRAEIRALFKASAVGLIAGCMVESGKVRRNASVRLVRDGAVVVSNATIDSLRREKDDVTEVSAGYECGMVLSYPDIEIGDIIEVFEQVEVPRS